MAQKHLRVRRKRLHCRLRFYHPAISQLLIAAISFVIACKELEISQPVEASFYGIQQAEGEFPPVRRIP